MNDPWQILILDRHTATEKDVKAAYARLLKQHRPDSDPEGFRRVREAYEAALNWLRNRASHSFPEVSYAADASAPDHDATGAGGTEGNRLDLPVVFEDFPLPADAQEALAEVEHAAQAGNVEQLEAALMAFHERCEACGASGMSRATALERAFQGRINDLASAVTNSFLIRMAELGQTNLPHLVVSAWQEADERGRLVQFSRALVEHARTLATPDGAFLLARVGVLTGLEQPEMASTLANAAYPHLPVDARNQVMAQLEQEAALGKIFAEVSPSMKPFWFKRVRQGGEGYDWNSPEARTALNDVIDRNRYVWDGWGIVRQLMPAANWALVEHRLRNQAQQVAANQPPRSSGFPGWIIVPAILVIINLLRFMANDKPPTRSYSDSFPRPAPSVERNSGVDWTRNQPAAGVQTDSSSWQRVPVSQKDRSTDWSHSLSMEDILAGKRLPQQQRSPEDARVPSGTESSLIPRAPAANSLPPLPSGGGESQNQHKPLQDLLQRGVLQDSVLQVPPAAPPGPIFQTR